LFFSFVSFVVAEVAAGGGDDDRDKVLEIKDFFGMAGGAVVVELVVVVVVVAAGPSNFVNFSIFAAVSFANGLGGIIGSDSFFPSFIAVIPFVVLLETPSDLER
jgi:hypothetical protein